MSEKKNTYIAIALVEYQKDGKRAYANPGDAVSLSDADAKSLLKVKAIRELTDKEKELEALRAKSAAADAEKSNKTTGKGNSPKPKDDADI